MKDRMPQLSRKLALVVTVLVLLMAVVTTGVRAQDGDETSDDVLSRLFNRISQEDEAVTESQLTVSGESQIRVAPDEARIMLSIETRSDAADEAVAENAELADEVMAALEDSEAVGAVTTAGFSVFPVEEPRQPLPERSELQESPAIETYRAVHRLDVEVTDVDAVGDVIALAVDAGATGVADIHFGLADPSRYRARALRQALRAAREEADAVAEALGAEIEGIVEIRTGGGGVIFEEAARGFDTATDFAQAPPISPDDVTVRAHVEVIVALTGADFEALPTEAAEDEMAMDAEADDAASAEDEDEANPEDEISPEPTEVEATDTPEADNDADAAATETQEADTSALIEDALADPTVQALATGLAAALGADGVVTETMAGELDFATLAAGIDATYAGLNPRVVIAANQDDFDSDVARWLPADVDPAVNFQRHFVVGVFLGSRSSTGAALNVEAVSMTDGMLMIRSSLVDAGDEQAQNTTAYQLIRLPRSAAPGDPAALSTQLEITGAP